MTLTKHLIMLLLSTFSAGLFAIECSNITLSGFDQIPIYNQKTGNCFAHSTSNYLSYQYLTQNKSYVEFSNLHLALMGLAHGSRSLGNGGSMCPLIKAAQKAPTIARRFSAEDQIANIFDEISNLVYYVGINSYLKIPRTHTENLPIISEVLLAQIDKKINDIQPIWPTIAYNLQSGTSDFIKYSGPQNNSFPVTNELKNILSSFQLTDGESRFISRMLAVIYSVQSLVNNSRPSIYYSHDYFQLAYPLKGLSQLYPVLKKAVKAKFSEDFLTESIFTGWIKSSSGSSFRSGLIYQKDLGFLKNKKCEEISTKNSLEKTFGQMNSSLSLKQPVMASIDVKLLNASQSGQHAILIIGRKSENNRCFYKIRNSWGSPDIFVTESQLRSHLTGISLLVNVPAPTKAAAKTKK